MVAFITILSAVIGVYCAYKGEQYETKLQQIRALPNSVTRMAFMGYLLNKIENYVIITSFSSIAFICGVIILIKEVFF